MNNFFKKKFEIIYFEEIRIIKLLGFRFQLIARFVINFCIFSVAVFYGYAAVVVDGPPPYGESGGGGPEPEPEPGGGGA